MPFTCANRTAAVALADGGAKSLRTLHGAETIAAVIVEPLPGQQRLHHQRRSEAPASVAQVPQFFLIFDEVITGFGRVGHAFAAERYGVIPTSSPSLRA